MSHYHGNFFPFHCVVNFQGLDHAVLIVLDDKGLTVLLSIYTGFFQLLEERFPCIILRAAGACNRVRLLDVHSQLLFLSNVACRVGLAIFSRVGNGMLVSIHGIHGVFAFAIFFIKLSLDLILAQLPGGNGDDGHSAIGFGLFVGFGFGFGFTIFSFAFQRHPGIGRAVGFKISKVKRSIATVLAAAPLLLF